jgi:hypothetical protein
MSTTETNGSGRAVNLPGLYRHPESGKEVVVQANPKLGSAMADGVVQVGFVYVGPAPVETKPSETAVCGVTEATAEPQAETEVAPVAKPKSLSQMNKNELTTIAIEKGIVIPLDSTNAEIADLIRAAS